MIPPPPPLLFIGAAPMSRMCVRSLPPVYAKSLGINLFGSHTRRKCAQAVCAALFTCTAKSLAYKNMEVNNATQCP